MNYDEIKENYPKAFTSTKEWIKQNYADSQYKAILFGLLSFEMQTGILLRFFDERGIMIGIMPFESHTNEWFYDYYIDDNPGTYSFESRAEANKAAFTKAFEILELKLPR